VARVGTGSSGRETGRCSALRERVFGHEARQWPSTRAQDPLYARATWKRRHTLTQPPDHRRRGPVNVKILHYGKPRDGIGVIPQVAIVTALLGSLFHRIAGRVSSRSRHGPESRSSVHRIVWWRSRSTRGWGRGAAASPPGRSCQGLASALECAGVVLEARACTAPRQIDPHGR
jgi:hypothetical protein